MGKVKRKEVIAQLKQDLLGKDSFRGVTLSYSWLANQWGHLALGFIPVLMLNAILIRINPEITPLTSATLIMSMWTLFEIVNYLLQFKNIDSNKLYLKKTKINVAEDTLVDLLFFGMGCLFAYLYLQDDLGAGLFNANGQFEISALLLNIPLIVFIILLLTIVPLSYKWYKSKIYIQDGNFPRQFRVSQWNSYIDNPTIIHDLISDVKKKTHLIIAGQSGAGKTSLGIGIGTDLSLRHTKTYYTTAIDFFSVISLYSRMYFENRTGRRMEVMSKSTSDLNKFKNADVIVIDDLNPGDPMVQEFIRAKDFFEIYEQYTNEALRTVFSRKNFIWVIGGNGEKAENDKNINTWSKKIRKHFNPEKLLNVTVSRRADGL